MGSRHSKAKSRWQDAVDDQLDDGEVIDLGRSHADTRAHNLHGLPEDVLRLICCQLGVRELGRAAQTCKTWRRVAYADVCWRHIAMQRGVSSDVHVRKAVARTYAEVFMPRRYRGSVTKTRVSKDVNLVVCSPQVIPLYGAGLGSGKSALTVRWVQRTFSSAYTTTIEDSYTRQMQLSKPGATFLVNVLDAAGDGVSAAVGEHPSPKP